MSNLLSHTAYILTIRSCVTLFENSLCAGMEPGFEPRGSKHELKKFQVTWFIKKKIMIDKIIALYYHKYLSQEKNNMNKKS